MGYEIVLPEDEDSLSELLLPERNQRLSQGLVLEPLSEVSMRARVTTGPLGLRGGGGSDSNNDGDDTGSNVSHADYLDMSDPEDYAGMEADYSADQAVRDQEREEEEEEMAARASISC